MKRGNASSHEITTKPEPLIIRARINGGKPEPIRMLQSSKEPELGQIFRGMPTRFKTNLAFVERTIRVVNWNSTPDH